MSTQPHQPRSITEISHLFLSSVRENSTKGMPRPVRVPPQQARQRTDMTIDLTPEEFAEVFGDDDKAVAATAPHAACDAQGSADEPSTAPIGPVRAILASHLGPHQLARVQEYASHLCAVDRRIGLIAVDACEFRLSIFEHNPHPQSAPSHEGHDSEVFDSRRMSESLEELAWDVDEWLLLLPSPRVPEARSLLRDVPHWTLLTSCDHDGVVSCYRTLKGLSDLHRPALSLATFDSASDAEASQAFQRLSSVCRQFLDWPLASETPISPSSQVTEHIVLWCCATRDKAQLATAPQWQVVADFISRSSRAPASTARPGNAAENPMDPKPAAASHATPAPTQPAAAVVLPRPAAAVKADASDVIDLPDDHATPAGIVSAVLRGGNELVECPVKAPMCPDASLAVSREHRLVLVAVAREGLSDLRLIGRAYQWLIENRALIGMAVPQMSIDAHQLPRLHLLVDHADMSAEVLQPILQSASVSVHAYRKLRWGGKTGLLLEAA